MRNRVFEWLFGTPFVFQRLRQWFLGGVDFSDAYAFLDVGPHDVVLDIGCGMGDAMQYLRRFKSYVGFDIDPRAIETFRKYRMRPDVTLHARACSTDDIMTISPTKVVMIGLLHHVDDSSALAILRALAATSSVRAVSTVDTVLLEGDRRNNVLARLDRGRFVRTISGLHELVESAGLAVARSFWIEAGNHLARYYGMLIVRAGEKA